MNEHDWVVCISCTQQTNTFYKISHIETVNSIVSICFDILNDDKSALLKSERIEVNFSTF